LAGWTPDVVLDEDVLLAAAVYEALHGGGKRVNSQVGAADGAETQADPWSDLASWRNVR